MIELLTDIKLAVEKYCSMSDTVRDWNRRKLQSGLRVEDSVSSDLLLINCRIFLEPTVDRSLELEYI